MDAAILGQHAAFGVAVLFGIVGVPGISYATILKLQSNERRAVEAFDTFRAVQHTEGTATPVMMPLGSEAEWQSFVKNPPPKVIVRAFDRALDEFVFEHTPDVDPYQTVESNQHHTHIPTNVSPDAMI